MEITCKGLIGGLAALAFVACLGSPSSSEPAVSVCGASIEHTVAAAIHVSRSTNSAAIDVVVFCDSSAERTWGTPGLTDALNATPKVYNPGA